MTLITEYIETGAPIDYGTGRRCTRGFECETYKQIAEVGKVHRFSVPHRENAKGEPTILFCDQCEKERTKRDVEPYELQGAPKVGRKTSYDLPNLRRYREKRHVSRGDLAQMAECGVEHIRRIERDKVQASTKLAAKFARVLEVDIRALRGSW